MKFDVRWIAAAALALLLAAPASAQRGTADFTRYVALGDSFGAGFTNGSLVMTHQQYSYPATIARQAGAPDFQQPLISEPGIPAELELVSIAPVVIRPKSAANGQPINLQLPRPYNNLSVPGFQVGDVLRNTGGTENSGVMAQIILRGIAPAADQALALNPTFITVWIGGNDVLGAILNGTPAALTPIDEFRADYTALLDKLIAGAPNAGIVTAGLPDLQAIPFANLIPPVLVNPATGLPVQGPDGNPIFLFAELGDGTVGLLPPGSRVNLPAAELLASGFGIPPTLAQLPPFNQLPNAGKPLPNTVVLTPAEWETIHTRREEIDAAIKEIAAARNIPVADLDTLFAELVEGVEWAGIELNTDFLTGGIIGYDGFHFTDIGYTLLANEFIRTINDAYDRDIPMASLAPFFEYNADEVVNGAGGSTISFGARTWATILSHFTGQSILPAPAEPKRRRGIRRF